MGGTGQLVRALSDLCLRNGVEILLNTDIETIQVKSDHAIGATTTDGKFLAADFVICNGDPPTVYTQMISVDNKRPKRFLPEKLTRYSMGLFVLFFGTRKRYDNVAHHTIWMGPRYKELLEDIFDKKILTDDFHYIYTGLQRPMTALRQMVVTVLCFSVRCQIYAAT